MTALSVRAVRRLLWPALDPARVELRSPLPVGECQRRLREELGAGDRRARRPGVTPIGGTGRRRRYSGRVDGAEIEVVKGAVWSDLAPCFAGRLEELRGGTRVSGGFRESWGKALALVPLAVLGVVSVAFLPYWIGRVLDGSAGATGGLLGTLAMLLAGLLFSVLLAWALHAAHQSSANAVLRFLATTLRTDGWHEPPP